MGPPGGARLEATEIGGSQGPNEAAAGRGHCPDHGLCKADAIRDGESGCWGAERGKVVNAEGGGNRGEIRDLELFQCSSIRTDKEV